MLCYCPRDSSAEQSSEQSDAHGVFKYCSVLVTAEMFHFNVDKGNEHHMNKHSLVIEPMHLKFFT